MKNFEEVIDSSEWFRDSNNWLKICFGYNNPINIGTIHSELYLINNCKENLLKLSNTNNLLFYGIGSGDTEMQIIDILSDKFPKINCWGLDINLNFLKLFSNSIRLKKIEKPDIIIDFYDINLHFEKLSRPTKEKINFFVLGSTIGNYNDINEILTLFKKASFSGDRFFITYQTNRHIEKIFLKYKNNILYNNLININNFDSDKIKWELCGIKIEATHDNVQLFRSLKYPTNIIISSFVNNGFKYLDGTVDEIGNLGMLIFERK